MSKNLKTGPVRWWIYDGISFYYEIFTFIFVNVVWLLIKTGIGFYLEIARHIYFRALPKLKKFLICYSWFAYLTFLTIWTWKGLPLKQNPHNENIIGVLTATTGTMVAIYFSLVFIPLNQIATKFSPKFLKYLRRDPILVSVFLFSIFTIVYDVFFLRFGTTDSIITAAFTSFVLFILLLGISITRIIGFSDPNNSILKPAHTEIIHRIRAWIPKSYKACRKSLKKTIGPDFAQRNDLCRLSVNQTVTDYIQSSLLPIREVALKSIKDMDLEQSRNSIQTMMSVMVHYLVLRKDYYSDNDPLLYFIYTEFKQLIQASGNELKLTLHPFIVDCWKNIGVYSAAVNVKALQRVSDGFNGLVLFPVKGLTEICTQNLLEMDSYAPGKACEALGDIGVQLMSEGYDYQAASVVEELEKISKAAFTVSVKNVSGSANYAIMRIYTAGLFKRNIGHIDPGNFPYKKINESISRLLNHFLTRKPATEDNMVLSSFIGVLLDPFKGLNLSRVAEYGIFAPELKKDSIINNLKCVDAVVNENKMALGKLVQYEDWYFSDQIISNLYRIFFHLLAYINPIMAKDHVLFYKEHPILDDHLIQKTTELILATQKVLINLSGSGSDRHLFHNEHLETLFSTYLVILYECKFRNQRNLEDLFTTQHNLFVEMLNMYSRLKTADNNDELYKYFRLLKKILEANNLNDLSSQFNVPNFTRHQSAGLFIPVYESEYPDDSLIDHHWIIKRPDIQVNTGYFSALEEKLKIDQLTIY